MAIWSSVHVRYWDWDCQTRDGEDIFRCKYVGKIVEGCEVLQPVPKNANNPNTASQS
jgi:hypothetical protein